MPQQSTFPVGSCPFSHTHRVTGLLARCAASRAIETLVRSPLSTESGFRADVPANDRQPRTLLGSLSPHARRRLGPSAGSSLLQHRGVTCDLELCSASLFTVAASVASVRSCSSGRLKRALYFAAESIKCDRESGQGCLPVITMILRADGSLPISGLRDIGPSAADPAFLLSSSHGSPFFGILHSLLEPSQAPTASHNARRPSRNFCVVAKLASARRAPPSRLCLCSKPVSGHCTLCTIPK